MQFHPSIKALVSVSALVCIFTLTACGSPPKREPYSGADQVGEIDPAMLVGNWKITLLNPVADENKGTITTAYESDGTWTSIVIPPPEQSEGLGPMQFEGAGTWQVNGDTMFGKTDEFTETTGNQFGGLMKSIMSLFKSKMSGTVNAYEMTADRMIFVNEEHGTATLLERI